MSKLQIFRAKIHQWFSLWWRITLEDIRAPLFDTGARLQFFLLVALLIFVLPPEGFAKWREELSNTMRTLQAFLYAFPLFVLFTGFIAVFKTTREQKRIGQWAKNRFVFHQKRQSSGSEQKLPNFLIIFYTDPEPVLKIRFSQA